MRKYKAYTLVEVLIVLAIVGIISLFFFYFIKIINQTTRISLEKTEKSLIMNTIINQIREDLYRAEQVTADQNQIQIQTGKENITYILEQGTLQRNGTRLNNDKVQILNLTVTKEKRLYKIKLQTNKDNIDLKISKRIP